MPEPDTQLDIFGIETPVSELPEPGLCTASETCQAAVDKHEPDCPVERRLRDDFGY